MAIQADQEEFKRTHSERDSPRGNAEKDETTKKLKRYDSPFDEHAQPSEKLDGIDNPKPPRAIDAVHNEPALDVPPPAEQPDETKEVNDSGASTIIVNSPTDRVRSLDLSFFSCPPICSFSMPIDPFWSAGPASVVPTSDTATGTTNPWEARNGIPASSPSASDGTANTTFQGEPNSNQPSGSGTANHPQFVQLGDVYVVTLQFIDHCDSGSCHHAFAVLETMELAQAYVADQVQKAPLLGYKIIFEPRSWTPRDDNSGTFLSTLHAVIAGPTMPPQNYLPVVKIIVERVGFMGTPEQLAARQQNA